MIVAQILFNLAAFLKIALIIYPCREQIYIFFKFERNFKVHFTITFILTAFAYGAPCVYPNVTNLLGLIGGIMTGSIGYSIPLLLKLTCLWKEGNKASLSMLFHLFLFLGVLVIQVVSTYISITSS